MSAGSVQLAALGMQDVYLTGSPQVTYFRGVYRRHTPFSVQSFNIPFQDRKINWGSQAICRVPFKGDMIQSATLAVTLPQVFPAGTQFKWNQPAQATYPQPYLFINGDPQKFFPTAVGVQTFFIVPPPSPSWIGTGTGEQLNQYISFSSSQNQFVLAAGVTSVAIYTADLTTVGIFWGLDPNSFSNQGTLNGQPATFWNFKAGGPTNFSVIQSGWIPYNASVTTNASNSLLFVGPSISKDKLAIGGGGTTTPALTGSGNQFSAPAWIQFQNFSNVQGASEFITYTKIGGNLQFKYRGIHAITITTTGLGAPIRVGVAHGSNDARPIKAYTYDYIYTWNVQFTNQNAKAVLPIYVNEPSQYYFVEFEGATIGNIGSDIEVLVEDHNELWSVGSNASIITNTLPFSNVDRYGITRQITPNVQSNTFTFLSAGLYNIYGSLSVNAANTISSVSLIEQTFTGLNTFGKANVVSQWNSPQASSPSINFTLPVQVLEPTKNNYSIIVSTNDSQALGNAIAPTTFSLEYFGTVTSPVTAQQNDFRQNGLFLKFNATAGVNYTMSTSNINLFSTVTTFGNSYHISISSGGNLNIISPSQYRISTYVETSNAYVSNVAVWSGASDAVLASSLLPGNSSQASLVASRTLPIGLQGGYTLDLIVPVVSTANILQIRVGFTGSQAGQLYTNVTSNSYFTVVGLTQSGDILDYSYIDSVGTYLVNSAELRIGGQTIQTLTGEMIEIYNDLTVPQENQPGLTLLTGKQLYPLAATDKRPQTYNPTTYYINLPFFFYGSADLSLPICALGLQDLEIWVNFGNYQSLLTIPGIQATPAAVTASIIIDYAYLSDPEINWFKSHRQDYVITQNQYASFILNAGLSFLLDFKGPVREFIFVIQDAGAAPYVYQTDPGIGLNLRFNGEDYIDSSTMDYNFMRFIGPLERYARQPTRTLHVVPFCRAPLASRPTGSINMSRIQQKNIEFILPTLPSLATKTIRLVAINYNILRVENGLAGIMYQ